MLLLDCQQHPTRYSDFQHTPVDLSLESTPDILIYIFSVVHQIFLNTKTSATDLSDISAFNGKGLHWPGYCLHILQTTGLSNVTYSTCLPRQFHPHTPGLKQEAHLYTSPVPSVHLISFNQSHFQNLDPTNHRSLSLFSTYILQKYQWELTGPNLIIKIKMIKSLFSL